MKNLALALSLSALGLPSPGVTANAPPCVLDRGACPFECCQYGEWEALRTVDLFAEPSASSKPIGRIPAGLTVRALTGQVRTQGQPFTVHRAHGRYQPGDTLMVYTYRGEGVFSVWYKGDRFEEQLDFSPYGGTGGERCNDKEVCWGSLAAKLQSEWWAKVRLPAGRVGWVRADQDAFSGQDACG